MTGQFRTVFGPVGCSIMGLAGDSEVSRSASVPHGTAAAGRVSHVVGTDGDSLMATDALDADAEPCRISMTSHFIRGNGNRVSHTYRSLIDERVRGTVSVAD